MRRALSFLLLLAPTAAAAQLPSASIRGLGLAGAYTVNARGFEAPAWNPAVLAGSRSPGFTLGLPQAQLEFGSNAYGLSDFQKYQGTHLSTADKTYLLSKIDTSLDLRTIVGIAPVGLSIWRFAASIGTASDIDAGLGKDAVDLVLNGNAARAGLNQFFTAKGTHARGWAATTLAGSFALPFQMPLGRLSVGATYKKVWGHGLGQAAELSSRFQVNPSFSAGGTVEAIYTNYPRTFDVKGVGDLLGGTGSPGTGYGVDVGGLLEMGHLTLGAVLVNAAGSMTWQTNRLRYVRDSAAVVQSGTGSLTDVTIRTTLDSTQIDADPVAKAFRDSVLAHANFARVLRAGASWRMGGLLLAADGQLRLSEGLDRQPKQAVSAGAEYVLLGVLPLRAGIGTDFSNTVTFSAGTGLYLGPLHIDVGVADLTGSTQAGATGAPQPGVRVGAGVGLIF